MFQKSTGLPVLAVPHFHLTQLLEGGLGDPISVEDFMVDNSVSMIVSRFTSIAKNFVSRSY